MANEGKATLKVVGDVADALAKLAELDRKVTDIQSRLQARDGSEVTIDTRAAVAELGELLAAVMSISAELRQLSVTKVDLDFSEAVAGLRAVSEAATTAGTSVKEELGEGAKQAATLVKDQFSRIGREFQDDFKKLIDAANLFEPVVDGAEEAADGIRSAFVAGKPFDPLGTQLDEQLREIKQSIDAANLFDALEDDAREAAAKLEAALRGVDPLQELVRQAEEARVKVAGDFDALVKDFDSAVNRLRAASREANFDPLSISARQMKADVDQAANAVVRFALDASAKLPGAVAEMRRVEAAAASVQRELAGFGRSSGDLGKVLGSLTRAVGSVQTAIYAFLTSLVAERLIEFGKAAVDIKIKFDAVAQTFKALAGGDLLEAARQMDFVKQTALDLGVNLLDASRGFARLSSAAKGTALEGDAIARTFYVMTGAAKVMGLSTDELNGVFKALTDIMSKNVVASEELKRQLGDRLPGAIQRVAEGMNLSTEELLKMVSAGEVVAEEMIPKLTDAMLELAGPSILDAASNLGSEIERVKTVFQEVAAAAVGEAEPGLKALLITIQDNREAFIEVGKTVGTFVNGLARLATVLVPLVLTFGAWLEKIRFVSLGIAKLQLELQHLRDSLNPFTDPDILRAQEENLAKLEKELEESAKKMLRQRDQLSDAWGTAFDNATASAEELKRRSSELFEQMLNSTSASFLESQARFKEFQQALAEGNQDRIEEIIRQEKEAASRVNDIREEAAKDGAEQVLATFEDEASKREALQKGQIGIERDVQEDRTSEAEKGAGDRVDLEKGAADAVAAEGEKVVAAEKETQEAQTAAAEAGADARKTTEEQRAAALKETLDNLVDQEETAADRRAQITRDVNAKIEKLEEESAKKREKLEQDLYERLQKLDEEGRIEALKKHNEEVAKLDEELNRKREKLYEDAARKIRNIQDAEVKAAEEAEKKKVKAAEAAAQARIKLEQGVLEAFREAYNEIGELQKETEQGAKGAGGNEEQLKKISEIKDRLAELESQPILDEGEVAELFALRDALAQAEQAAYGFGQTASQSFEDVTAELDRFGRQAIKAIGDLLGDKGFQDGFESLSESARLTVTDIIDRFEEMARGGRATQQDLDQAIGEITELFGSAGISISQFADPLTGFVRDDVPTLTEGLKVFNEVTGEAGTKMDEAAGGATTLQDAIRQTKDAAGQAGEAVSDLADGTAAAAEELEGAGGVIETATQKFIVGAEGTEQMVEVVDKVADGAKEAADGAEQLADGLQRVSETQVPPDAAEAVKGLGEAAGEAAAGVAPLADESERAAEGVGSIANEGERLQTALTEAAAAIQALSDGLLTFAPAIAEGGVPELLGQLADAATALAEPAERVAASLAEMATASGTLSESLPAVSTAVTGLGEASGVVASSGSVQLVADSLGSLEEAAGPVSEHLSSIVESLQQIATAGPEIQASSDLITTAIEKLASEETVERIGVLGEAVAAASESMAAMAEASASTDSAVASILGNLDSLLESLARFSAAIRDEFIPATDLANEALAGLADSLESASQSADTLLEHLMSLGSEGAQSIGEVKAQVDGLVESLEQAVSLADTLREKLAGIKLPGGSGGGE